jgi:hypothetical protein
MRWNDIIQMKNSRRICHRSNLERELNNEKLLKTIHQRARSTLGIPSSQSILIDVLVEKLGEVVFQYAGHEISSDKVVAVLNEVSDKRKACEVIGCTIVCLLERYGMISGPKL